MVARNQHERSTPPKMPEFRVQRPPGHGVLKLDSAARAFLGIDENLTPEAQLQIGPDLAPPFGGQTLASWLYDWLGSGIEVGFFTLRSTVSERFGIVLVGDGAVVDTAATGSNAIDEISTDAHDFRNGLNIVQTNTELLQLLTDKGGNQEFSELVARLQRNLPRLRDRFEAVVASVRGTAKERDDLIGRLRKVIDRTAAAGRILAEGEVSIAVDAALRQAATQFVLEWASHAAGPPASSRLRIEDGPEGSGALLFTGDTIGEWVRALAAGQRHASWLEAVGELGLVGGAWRDGDGGQVLLGSTSYYPH
jgi:hypothetical protein